MAGKAASFDLDDTTAVRLADAARREARQPSQMLGVALRMFLDTSPGARRALQALDEIADPNERRWVAGVMSRAALKALEAIIRDRNRVPMESDANTPLDTEEEIEAEAVRACRR